MSQVVKIRAENADYVHKDIRLVEDILVSIWQGFRSIFGSLSVARGGSSRVYLVTHPAGRVGRCLRIGGQNLSMYQAATYSGGLI